MLEGSEQVGPGDLQPANGTSLIGKNELENVDAETVARGSGDMAADAEVEVSPAELRQERVAVKFLVPNVAAGTIIGKAGANISEIQSQSKARMQLSKSNEFYPGTSESQDRVLLVSGTVDQLLTALHLILTKLKGESTAIRAVQSKDGEKLQLRLLVHTRLCGTLIGKGGATIRSFKEDSNAIFNISPPPVVPGLVDRIVRITGHVEELMRAVALVVTKLAGNPDYHLLTDANLSYSVRTPGDDVGINVSYDTGSGALENDAHPVTVSLAVPEACVGAVIGKQGAVVTQIKDLMKVDIRISRKGEYLPGTNDRTCRITGAPQSVELAQRLIVQRIRGR